MSQTEACLKDLIEYAAISRINPLEPPSIKKEEIPNLIHCHNFARALEKRDRMMERYHQKVSTQRQKVDELEVEIAHLSREIKKRTDGSLIGNLMGKTLSSNKPGWFDNAEEHNKKVDKYNAILEVVRRLQDQQERVAYRRDDAVEKHNEAVEEAKEKLEELTAEALLVIDDDVVAVMDKTSKVALKLANSQNTPDLFAAIEVCYLQLKLNLVLEDHIEGNNQRREFKDRLLEAGKLLVDLCARQEAIKHVADLFQRNARVIADNQRLNAEVVNIIRSFDVSSMDKYVVALRQLFAASFTTEFAYQHLIDPSELNQVVMDIRVAIDNLRNHATKVNNTFGLAKPAAEQGIATQQAVKSLFAEMKNNNQRLANEALHNEHFACEMLNPAVIDDFYSREVKPAVTVLRDNVAGSIGKAEFEALIHNDADRYFIKRTETVIEKANLLRLQVEIDKVDSYLKHISGRIDAAEEDIERINEVPREKTEQFRKKASTAYTLSCFPWLGVGFALSLLLKVKAFAAAFKSSNEIYRELGTELLQKTATMKKVTLILGAILGLGGLIIFLAANLSDNMAVNVGIPGSALLLYLCTSGTFVMVEKLIREYQARSEVVVEEEKAIAQHA